MSVTEEEEPIMSSLPTLDSGHPPPPTGHTRTHSWYFWIDFQQLFPKTSTYLTEELSRVTVC